MTHIEIQPADVWAFIQGNEAYLEDDDFEIASNSDYGVSITVFVMADRIQLAVWMDGQMVQNVNVTNSKQCEEQARALYDEYLTSQVFETVEKQTSKPADPDEHLDALQKQEVDLREEELSNAVLDLIMIALDDDYDGDEDITVICDRAKEAFLGFLGKRLNLPVYRPMLLEADDGTEFYSDYPYQSMS